MYSKRYEKCPDTRECFARLGDECVVLQRDSNHSKIFYTEDRECPFCKPERDVTDGKRYFYNPVNSTKSLS